MMEILRGSPALSAFRITKLLARFQAADLPVSNIYAEYVHFADLNAPSMQRSAYSWNACSSMVQA